MPAEPLLRQEIESLLAGDTDLLIHPWIPLQRRFRALAGEHELGIMK